MSTRTMQARKVEVFSAGCPLCDDAVALVREIAGAAHDVAVHSLNEPTGASRGRELGVRSVPAVSIDGELIECCAGRGVSEQALREGLDQQGAARAEKEHRRGGCC